MNKINNICTNLINNYHQFIVNPGFITRNVKTSVNVTVGNVPLHPHFANYIGVKHLDNYSPLQQIMSDISKAHNIDEFRKFCREYSKYFHQKLVHVFHLTALLSFEECFGAERTRKAQGLRIYQAGNNPTYVTFKPSKTDH